MALEQAHMEYPMRRYGMDHDRYKWSMLIDRKPVVWPQGKKLAVWINVSMQFFPLNPSGKPVAVPGNMTMPYPDLRHFTLRDYGNRVGIQRFLRAFERYDIRPTYAVNARLAERCPDLIRQLASTGSELLGHSWSMDTAHAGGLDLQEEAALIKRSLETLQRITGKRVRGWLSPGRLNSENTPDLLKAEGIEYFCDWVNDELPYRFATRHGDLWAVPLATEIEDRFVVMDNFHSEESWAQQVMDACDLLRDEAQREGGRMLSLSLHPWVLGQPHRIKHLEAVLEYLSGFPDIWYAGAGEILDAFVAQQ